MFKNTVIECNQALDEMKMNGDYAGIIELLDKNREMLLSAGWKVDILKKRLEQIIELHNSI